MSGYTVLLTLQVAPDRMAEFEAMMTVEAPLTRGFEGCDLFEIYATETPGEVLFLEHWASKGHSDRYGEWRAGRGDFERLGAFFTAPPTRTVLRHLP